MTELLDLRALEAAYRDSGPNAHDGSTTILALVAALRELRWAALWEVERHGHWHGRGDMAPCDCRLCTALDKVRDDA